MEWFDFVNKSRNKEWINVACSEILRKGEGAKALS